MSERDPPFWTHIVTAGVNDGLGGAGTCQTHFNDLPRDGPSSLSLLYNHALTTQGNWLLTTQA